MALAKQMLVLIFISAYIISVTCQNAQSAPSSAPAMAPIGPDGEKDKPTNKKDDKIDKKDDKKDDKIDDKKDKKDDKKDKKDDKIDKKDDKKDKKDDKKDNQDDKDKKDNKDDKDKKDDKKDKDKKDDKKDKKDDKKDKNGKKDDKKDKKDKKDDKKDKKDKKDDKKDKKDDKKDKKDDKKEDDEKEDDDEEDAIGKDVIEKEGGVANVAANRMRKVEMKISEFNVALKQRMDNPESSPGSKECVTECDEVLGAAIDDIKKTLESLDSQNLVKAKFDISAVSTNVDTCNDCFDEMVGGDPKVKKLSDWVQKTTGDVLEVIQKPNS